MKHHKKREPCCQRSYKMGYETGRRAIRSGYRVNLEAVQTDAPFGKPLPWADAVKAVYLDAEGREHIEYA